LTFAENNHPMTIHIKDQYQPQRELTVAQANLELQSGKISTTAMAWKPGMEQWAPILSLPEIQAPVPPPTILNAPDAGRAPHLISSSTDQSSTSRPGEQATAFLRFLAGAGILLAYAIVVVTCFSSSAGQKGTQTVPLLGAFVGIALFRRLTRKRSEAMAIKHPSSGWLLHYARSYFSASWRWLLLFFAIAFLAALSLETAEEMGAAAGRAIGMMIFTMLFAVDIPFRTFRRFRRESISSFPERHLAWGIFGGIMIPLSLVGLFAFMIPAFTGALAKGARVQELSKEKQGGDAGTQAASAPSSNSVYISPDGRWQVAFPTKCKIEKLPLDVGGFDALRTIYSSKVNSSSYFSVETVEYPDELIQRHGNQISLDGARDGALATTGGTLISERSVSQNGLNGKELLITSKSKKFYIRSRIFYEGNTLFSVIAVSRERKDSDSERFLNSFAFN